MPEPLKLLFDGQCSLCRQGVLRLKRRDTQGIIVAEDISDPKFDPGRYALTRQDVLAVMHVVLPDGRVLRAMDAMRAVYAAVGLGWLVAPTGWPGIRWLFDRLYAFFARHRLTFSRLFGRRCESGGCTIHRPK